VLCKILQISEKESFGWDFRDGLSSPTCFIILLAQNRPFLPLARKEKSLNLIEIQGFA